MYGIDIHPEYQKGIDFDRIAREGYKAVFIKVSEGTSFRPSGLKAFVVGAMRHENTSIVRQTLRELKAAVLGQELDPTGYVIGYYHFLDNSDGDKQAAHFVNTVRELGGHTSKALIVDFENYGAKSPSNNDLKKFVHGVKARTGKNVILYSGYGFWTGGESSGDASQYDVDGLWDARYADLNKHDNPKAYWSGIRDWWLRQPRWGGNPPPPRIAGQFTSQGLVAGKYVDVNHFFIKRRKLIRQFVKR